MRFLRIRFNIFRKSPVETNEDADDDIKAEDEEQGDSNDDQKAPTWQSLNVSSAELRPEIVLTNGQSFSWKSVGENEWKGVA